MATAENAPLVLTSTAADPVPVIIETPHDYPWEPGEREQWREASNEEYDRYAHYWDTHDD